MQSGTNVHRRYASQVYRKDFTALDSLHTEEKSWIAPLPIAYDANLKPYQDMLSMMGGHGGSTLPKAQALKDATMAYFTLKEWEPGRLYFPASFGNMGYFRSKPLCGNETLHFHT